MTVVEYISMDGVSHYTPKRDEISKWRMIDDIEDGITILNNTMNVSPLCTGR